MSDPLPGNLVSRTAERIYHPINWQAPFLLYYLICTFSILATTYAAIKKKKKKPQAIHNSLPHQSAARCYEVLEIEFDGQCYFFFLAGWRKDRNWIELYVAD